MWFDSTSSHFEVNEKTIFYFVRFITRLLRHNDYLFLDLCDYVEVEITE